MTWHIHYDHKCSECGAFYIPFGEVEPCPRCGRVETERYDFIPEAAMSASANIRVDGSYMPSAWYVGSLGDHLLHLLFGLLEKHRTSDQSIDFDAFSRAAIHEMEWDDQEHMRDHLHRISLGVFAEIQRRRDAKPTDHDNQSTSGGL